METIFMLLTVCRPHSFCSGSCRESRGGKKTCGRLWGLFYFHSTENSSKHNHVTWYLCVPFPIILAAEYFKGKALAILRHGKQVWSSRWLAGRFFFSGSLSDYQRIAWRCHLKKNKTIPCHLLLAQLCRHAHTNTPARKKEDCCRKELTKREMKETQVNNTMKREVGGRKQWVLLSSSAFFLWQENNFRGLDVRLDI